MNKAATALSLATALLIPGISPAANLSYDFIELNYSSTDLDLFSDNLTGVDLYLNKSITNNVYLLIDYGSFSVDTPQGDIDISGISLGAGYHYPINDKTDLYAELAFQESDTERGGVSIDENGYGYGVGVRSKLTDKIEGLVFVSRTDIEDKTDNSVDIQLAFEFVQNMQITGGIDFEDERTSRVGLRFNF